jgi:type IV pilus assembly protein PilO
MKIPSGSTWLKRLRAPLTTHCAGLAALVLLDLWLIVWICVDWRAIDTGTSTVLNRKQFELSALHLETVPLYGLDRRLVETQQQVEAFYARRIPANYSSIAIHIGELEVQSGVRLSRVQYTQGPPGLNLTEISMDAGISGEYPQIMRFVNRLERDQNFFVIRAMMLAGQEGGLVNLRLRVSTWLRPTDAAASGLPVTPMAGAVILRSAPSARGGG